MLALFRMNYAQEISSYCPHIVVSDLEELVYSQDIKYASEKVCLGAVSVTRDHIGACKQCAVITVDEMQRMAMTGCLFVSTSWTEVFYSDPMRQNFIFDMEGRIPKNSEVTMAELKLFKKPLDRVNLPARQPHRPVSNARVSIYWVQRQHDGTNRTSLIDSR